MSESPQSTRRWFQFSLGTMLMIVLTVALAAYSEKQQRENAKLRSECTMLKQEVAAEKKRAERYLQIKSSVEAWPTGPRL